MHSAVAVSPLSCLGPLHGFMNRQNSATKDTLEWLELLLVGLLDRSESQFLFHRKFIAAATTMKEPCLSVCSSPTSHSTTQPQDVANMPPSDSDNEMPCPLTLTDPDGVTTGSFEALQSDEQRKILDFVDHLRGQGLSSVIELPQIFLFDFLFIT